MKKAHFITAPAKSPDWTLLARIALSVITFGWGWVTGNQAIIIAFAASLIVWVLTYFADRQWNIGKTVKTIVLFVIALILQLWFTPVDLPPWSPDDLPGYFGALFEVVETVIAAATLLYNLLLAEILKQLPDGVNWLLKRPRA